MYVDIETATAASPPALAFELPHPDCPQSAGFPQHPAPLGPALAVARDALVPAICAAAVDRPGQVSHCAVDTELLIAAQKALPKASSAHARQLDGSPEQVAARGVGMCGCDGAEEIGKMDGCDGVKLAFMVRRRRGTAGWKAGRLSRIDCCDGTVGANCGVECCETEVCISMLSTFIDTVLCAAIRSDTCCIASSRQTHGILSVQKPQLNVSNGSPGSNKLDLSVDIKSNRLPSPLPCGTTGVSRGSGRSGNGEKLLWDEESFDLGDDAREDGEEAWDIGINDACTDCPSKAILTLLFARSSEAIFGDKEEDSSLLLFLAESRKPARSSSICATFSLSIVFSARSFSFSSLSRFAIFCNATLRSISPCSYCWMRCCSSAS